MHKKTPTLESLFNKTPGSRPATLLKKRLQHRCFPVNYPKFLRTPFLQNTSGRLVFIDWFLGFRSKKWDTRYSQH